VRPFRVISTNEYIVDDDNVIRSVALVSDQGTIGLNALSREEFVAFKVGESYYVEFTLELKVDKK
jgi:hypothetical protein